MQNLIDQIFSNHFYTIIALIIIVALVFFVVKKLFKLAIYAVIIFIGFLSYAYFTGGDVKEIINKTIDKGEKILNDKK